jgi:hypothetical protein
MSKVSNFISFLLEDVIILVQEGLDEQFFEFLVDKAEPLGKQSEKGLVNPLHHAALEDHIDQFMLVTLGDIHFEYFVSALLEVDGRLYCQIDGFPQIY